MYKFDNMEGFKYFCFTNNYERWDKFYIKINKEWRIFKLDCSVFDINFRYKEEDLYSRSYIYIDDDERMIFIDILGNFKDEKQQIVSIDFYSKKGINTLYINDKVDKEIFKLIDESEGHSIKIMEQFSEECDLYE